MYAILNLMQSCVEDESKLLILEMLQHLVRATKHLLTPHMLPVYAFLKETWRQHCGKGALEDLESADSDYEDE